MIIGKPISFGNSSQGLLSEILVTGDVLSTDTVTATKGLVTVNAIWVTDHFVIGGLELGTWTVTATRGSHTDTKAVLIDEVAQYEVEVAHFTGTYLYNLGDECESITGGWTSSGFEYDNWGTSNYAPTKNATNISLNANTLVSALGRWSAIGTINKINVTNYSKIVMAINWGGTELNLECDVSSISQSGYIVPSINHYNGGNKILRLALSSTKNVITGNIATGYISGQTADAYRSGTISKIWLE